MFTKTLNNFYSASLSLKRSQTLLRKLMVPFKHGRSVKLKLKQALKIFKKHHICAQVPKKHLQLQRNRRKNRQKAAKQLPLHQVLLETIYPISFYVAPVSAAPVAAAAAVPMPRPADVEAPALPNKILFVENLPAQANALMLSMLFQQ